MSFNLRKRTHVSYYEPTEPNFDEYICKYSAKRKRSDELDLVKARRENFMERTFRYCERCADFVYDYCAIHGPLLVVPDNKVPVKPAVPSNVPRAALTIPDVFLHLAPSIIPGAGLGVFSSLTLPRGVRFGPYCGQRTQRVDSVYCWQIFDNNNKRLHVIDAADSDRSNWMRYVNCARHSKEQNLLAYQYKGQLYYRTIKIIPRYTELMVFYGSEFANALHINLKLYNSAKYYKEIIGTSTTALRKNEDDCMKEDYLTEDHFHFIDEENDVENSSKTTKSTYNLNKTKTGDSSPQLKENKVKKDDTQNSTEIKHECEICQKTLTSSKKLNQHVLKHLDTRKYNCEYCLYKTNEKYRYNQHLGYHTNSLQFSCDKCPFKTNYGKSLKRHSLRHGKLEMTPKTCKLCDYKTVSLKAFFTHMCKHKGNVFDCDKCSYSSYSKYNLSRHILRKRH